MDYIERATKIKELHSEGKTMEAIGKLFEISRQRVHQILNTDYSDIKNKKIRRIKLVDKYPQLRKLAGREYNREMVRIRDNHTCQLCGKRWIEGERRLDIHHLDCQKEKTKQYDTPEEFNNMITLCHRCHLNVPHHRQAMRDGYRKSMCRKIETKIGEK